MLIRGHSINWTPRGLKPAARLWGCCVLFLMAAAPALLRAGEMTFAIVEDGKAVVNVVAAGDDETLTAAVADLRTYVERISGAKLDVTPGTADRPGPTLHIGETDLFAQTAAARERITFDGFAVVAIGDDLLIAGNLPQGTANGVITMLQDQFGVRWYYADALWETVPSNQSLAIRLTSNAGDDAYVENPSFIERSYWGGSPTKDFGRRARLTQPGVKMPYVGTSHHLNHVVPVDKYAKDHPDYFALDHGKRQLDDAPHPCFTHPDMFDVFMAYVREGGKSFGVNDNLSACKCPRCLEIDGESEPYEGMWNFSESYFQLMARVAKQTAKEYPDRRLGVFAYQLTNAPPKTVDHVGDNVDVILCQDTAQNFDPAYRERDQAMAAEWVRKVGHVRFYDYVGINYWTPRYFPHVLADQMKHLARVGVVGYGTHSSTMIDSSMPMWHLLNRLLWNAELDPDAVIDEMLTGLYGDAREPIRAFYDHWETCWNRQDKGKWFRGMDNFRAEMRISTWDDVERGRRFLDEAAALAKDDTVRKRIDYLRDRYAFTYASANAYEVSMNAIRVEPPDSYDDAIALSNGVADAWAAFAETLDRSARLPGIPPHGWIDKTFRVRAWGLKQQMRDAALAPLIRWACANESRIEPDRLTVIERTLAGVAIRNRGEIERRVTADIGAATRLPRANGLPAASAPRVREPIAITAADADWPSVSFVDALPWIFRDRPPGQEIGRYDEPLVENVVDPPATDDQSMRWQAAWDDNRFYLRVVVRDELHVQDRPAESMWEQDCLQVAFTPARDDFELQSASWDYIWGGYRGQETEFGISLHGDTTESYVWKSPPLNGGVNPASLITARAARHRSETVYEAAVDWRLIPGFTPAPRRSFGISLVVNDIDKAHRRSAEYGSGVVRAKRPTEFAALRLAE